MSPETAPTKPFTARLDDGTGRGFEFTGEGRPEDRVYYVDGAVAYDAPTDTAELIRSQYALETFDGEFAIYRSAKDAAAMRRG